MSYKIKYVQIMHDDWFKKHEFIKGDCTLFPISWWDNKLQNLYGHYSKWKYNQGTNSQPGNPSVFKQITRKSFLKNTKLTEDELDFIEQLLKPIIDKYYKPGRTENNMGKTFNDKVPIDKDIEIMIITIINNAKLR